MTAPAPHPTDFTVPVTEFAPEDAMEILIAWMSPLRRTAEERIAGDVLPFTLISHVGGTENEEEGTAAPILSVHTLTDKALGRANMTVESKATHRRVLRLARHVDPITLTDGRPVGIDYIDVIESPLYVPYGDDQILRKVGRYEVGLTYVPTS